MAHSRIRKALAAVSILVLVLVSILAVSCDIQFAGGTAIQEVFEDELVNDDVSLHPTDGTKVTIRIVPDTSVPEAIAKYEVLIYRTNSKVLYRTVEVGSTFTLELNDIPRVSYRVVGRAVTEDGVPVAEGEACVKVSSNGADVVIELKDVGHIMEHHDKVDATCTEPGGIEHWHCTRCGLDFTDEKGENHVADTTIPALGHSMVHVKRKAPTCTEKGNEEHWHCDRCWLNFVDKEGSSEIQDDDIVLPALGHDWLTEWSHDEHSHWHSCTRCSATSVPFEHSMAATEDRKDPTEDEAGYIAYKCSVCGFERKDILKPIGHDWIEVDRKDSTCLEEGFIAYRCSDCGKAYREVLSKVPHSITYVAAVAATCTEPGSKEYWYCSTCGLYYSNEACSEKFDNEDNTVIDALGHDWPSTWEKDSDSHWRKCKRQNCGEIQKEHHSYDQQKETTEYRVSDATCESPAIYLYSCICGERGTKTFNSTTDTAKGHELEPVPAKQATCGEAGNEEYWRCTRTNCGKLFSDAKGEHETSLEKVKIPATGKHVFTNEDNPSGSYQSTSEGHYRQCLVCHKSIGDIERHTWTKANDADCHWDECQVCHYNEKDKTKEPHSYKDGFCQGCGRYGEDNPSSGFDVVEENSEPIGFVEYSSIGNNNWVFEFIDKSTKEENKITQLFWYLDGEKQSVFDGKTIFTLNTPKRQSYIVLCVYSNGHGYGSWEISINGN